MGMEELKIVSRLKAVTAIKSNYDVPWVKEPDQDFCRHPFLLHGVVLPVLSVH